MARFDPDLQRHLDDWCRQARPGDRLPTIRELMRRFGVSQMVVQQAFRALKERGLIDSQVGRGTYFTGDGPLPGVPAGAPVVPAAKPAATRSVLLLRRSISIARGRILLEGLQRRFGADGCRVLEVSYTDPAHALTVLRGLPHFDACVVQSTFKPIPIDLLAALREKSGVLAVDGAALFGSEVESVGTEWGEPLAEAVALLVGQGHRRIAYAATSQPLLATQLGWRRFERLCATLPGVTLEPIVLSELPDEGYEDALVEALRARQDAERRLPFGALVAWGIEDGARFLDLLARIGVAVPEPLSVVLLGRTDVANEHAGTFDTIGCRVADQVEALYEAVRRRWEDPARPFGVRLIPLARVAGQSVAPVGEAAARASGRSRRATRSTVSTAIASDSPV